jgi:pyruvate/2-oxoglutarate dehydrogenase complex dihydrolipoamide dehydrogenase (E3) component
MTVTGTDATVISVPPGTGWDLLVVGGGTAGIVGAKTAASLGASVLLVERDRPGGDCLWTGCVPSKALLSAAARAAGARDCAGHGVHVDGVRVDFAAVMAHVHQAVAAVEPADSPQALAAAGVVVLGGEARFTGPATVSVSGREIRFRQALLATGAHPAVPPIPGLADAVAAGLVLISDTVWELPERPGRLVVLGGGSIGCELGQAFARLGARVTIVEAAPRLLPREDPDASTVVEGALRADGVTVLTGAAVRQVCVDSCSGGAGGGHLLLDGGGEVGFDRLLVAAGRTPRTGGLGLDLAGVAVDGRGFVVVDEALRTTNRRVWAAGDLTGHPQFTHVAGVHASTAATNAVLGLRRRAQTVAIPRVTFTDPEVASVGESAAGPGTPTGTGTPAGTRTRAEARAGAGRRVVTRAHADVDRAVTDGATAGFSRLVLDRSGRVVGATLVGPRAGESLAELVLAVRLGVKAQQLAGTVHAYPTYGDGPWNAAIADVRGRLAAPGTARLIRALARARRRWLDLRG